MPVTRYPIFVGGEVARPNDDLEVRDKFTGATIARCAVADTTTMDEAIAYGVRAREPMGAMPAHARRDALGCLRDAIADRREEFAQMLTAEVGKPIIFARVEVDRTIDTLRLSMEACSLAHTGEHLPMDGSPSGAGYEGILRRFPIGLCAFITPFNFPLNLLAHKIGPALAAGCPFIVKPSEKTPVTTMMVGEILAGLDLPTGAFSVVNALGEARAMLATDERIRFLSFTGSGEVGWALRANAGTKRVALELGGNAACIIDEGVDESVDLDFAIERIAMGAFAQAGQSCISVQRVLCHESLIGDVRRRLIERIATIQTGDPRDEVTWIGPMIDEDAATRVESSINAAIDTGAEALVRGERAGAMMTPTLLTGVDPGQDISCKEAFGPVAVLSSFTDFDEALAQVNDSPFGLQTGVFTPRLDRSTKAFETLEVGAVVINDIPTMRVDSMPYGGVKASGLGREGVRWAVEAMTEPRLMLIRK